MQCFAMVWFANSKNRLKENGLKYSAVFGLKYFTTWNNTLHLPVCLYVYTRHFLCWWFVSVLYETWSWLFVSAQVRRMVGVLVAVGRGELSVDQVQDLLDTRDSMAYPQNMAAPPYGLFLINVEYNDAGKVSLFVLRSSVYHKLKS